MNAKIRRPRFIDFRMRQLILDLLPDTSPSLDNFVTGQDRTNSETLQTLTGWLAGQYADPSFCLWGEAGCGKTHLLKATGFTYLDATTDPDLAQRPVSTPETLPDPVAVDNVQALSAEGQIALFNLFNHLKMQGGQLLTSCPQPPAHLDLREDLRTRLGSGLIYRLQPLSDADKAAALLAQAKERALKLPPEAIDYLLRHAPRDMRTLSGLIVALDRHTLEHKRVVTIPLLRDLLSETLPQEIS